MLPRERLRHARQGFPAAGIGFATATRRPVLHLCALAYERPPLLGSAQVSHLDVRQLQVASLDHAMVHTCFAPTVVLYDQSSPSASGGHALDQGRFSHGRGDGRGSHAGGADTTSAGTGRWGSERAGRSAGRELLALQGDTGGTWLRCANAGPSR